MLIAWHERPRLSCLDPRIEFIELGWPALPPGLGNDDSGRKKHLLADIALARGGGRFMILDADDWVDAHLVRAARATISQDAVGGLIEAGVAIDFQTLRAAPLPHPHVSELAFHRLCGPCGIVRLRPAMTKFLRRNAFNVLRSHHRWIEAAAEHGAELTRLSVAGAYVINTLKNHSEFHDPHVDWRRSFTTSVNAAGEMMDMRLAAQFGLDVAHLGVASTRFFARVPCSAGRGCAQQQMKRSPRGRSVGQPTAVASLTAVVIGGRELCDSQTHEKPLAFVGLAAVVSGYGVCWIRPGGLAVTDSPAA